MEIEIDDPISILLLIVLHINIDTNIVTTDRIFYDLCAISIFAVQMELDIYVFLSLSSITIYESIELFYKWNISYLLG